MQGSALTPFALFFMLLSMGAVTVLMIYCFWRILRGDTSPGYEAAGPPGGEGGSPASGSAEPGSGTGQGGPEGG